jgi:NADH-quinone oxidoreductase subunit M
MLSSIGLPGLNGFVGEFLVLLGGFTAHRWWAVVAATGVILAALYLLWAYQRVFHGTPDEDNASMPDLRFREALLMTPLVGLIVFLGIYPKPVLDRMEPSVDALIAHIEEHVPDFHEPEPKLTPDDIPAEAGTESGDAGEGEH